MQQKQFDSLVIETFGKQSRNLASILFEKKNVNEFLIAKKLGLTPNQVRNILYKFSHIGIVSFTRKKDKRKGWYTYFWTLNLHKTLSYIKKELEKEIDNFENQLKSREIKRFYICPICRTEVSEENALMHDFTCPECGSVYELSSGEKIVSEVKSKLRVLSNRLAFVIEELDKVKAKEEKSRLRLEVKKKKEKSIERAKKREEKKKLEKKLKKKPIKKKAKKKKIKKKTKPKKKLKKKKPIKKKAKKKKSVKAKKTKKGKKRR